MISPGLFVVLLYTAVRSEVNILPLHRESRVIIFRVHNNATYSNYHRRVTQLYQKLMKFALPPLFREGMVRKDGLYAISYSIILLQRQQSTVQGHSYNIVQVLLLCVVCMVLVCCEPRATSTSSSCVRCYCCSAVCSVLCVIPSILDVILLSYCSFRV